MKDSTDGIHVWLVLMKAFHALQAHARADLAQTGLGISDFAVLEVLLHKGPMPVNHIGPKVNLTPGSISTAVDRLYDRKLVTRTESAQDRRVRTVELTAKGRALIQPVFANHAATLEQVATGLTRQERAQLTGLLKKLGRYAESLPC